ncbi:MAG: hypothetical protein GY760_24525 [Deltaproteobacteria bacterium]|nr:hypothetical protein [Deltaproteobacteria bacterium]
MDTNQNRIDEINKEIEVNNSELKKLYQSVGERVAEPGVRIGDDEEIDRYLNDISALNKKSSNIEDLIIDLKKSYCRISEISEREKIIGEEYSLIEKENRKLFQPVGNAVYIEWKKNPSDENLKAMENLEVTEKKIVTLENEIFQIQNNESKQSVLDSIKSKSRLILLKTQKGSHQSSLNNLYRRSGEKLYKKNLTSIKNIDNEFVVTLLGNNKKLHKYDDEIKNLKNENSELMKQLKSKFQSGKQQKSEEKLRIEKEAILIERLNKLHEIGRYIHNENFSHNDDSIISSFSEIDKIISKNEEFINQIDLYKAEQEIIKLDEEIDDIKNNIKDLQVTIEKCNSDISEFNKEIKRAKSEIKKLKKITEEKAQETDK